MTTLIRVHFAIAAVFLAAAIAFPLYHRSVYPEPPLLQRNTEFKSAADKVQDLEHLRKVLYTVIVKTDAAMVEAKALNDEFMKLSAVILAGSALIFGLSGAQLYRLRRRSPNKD